MTSRPESQADAPLWTRGTHAPTGWVDRVLFDMHASSEAPWLFVVAGKTPSAQVRDGAVVFVDRATQRNLRFSAAGLGGDEIGPLRWQVLESSRHWRLRLDDNPSGIAFDVDWRSRGRVWSSRWDDTGSDADSVPAASWAHQSGVYSGWLSVDGTRRVVDGWWGQRSRVRGFPEDSGQEMLRMWGHGQFDDWTLSFTLVQDSPSAPLHVSGAILPVGGVGDPDPIVAARHAVRFDDESGCTDARVALTSESGAQLVVDMDTRGHRGGHLAGAGFGGWFGTPRGEHVEHDRWALRGPGRTVPLTPRSGRLCRWTSRGTRVGTGSGIVGVVTQRRSDYEPTLRLP